MKSGRNCPVCALRETVENRRVEYYLGGSVMEPDVRIQVNKKGFCAAHQRALLGQKNKLGLALLMLSHADETLRNLDRLTPSSASAKRGFPLFKKTGNPEAALEDPLCSALLSISQGCVICDDIRETMAKYLYTFLHLYRNDASFRSALEKSKGLCIPDTAALIALAKSECSPEELQSLSSLLLDHLKDTLQQDRDDLEYFTQKFDYRNSDKPWGNSKDALERTINLMQGECTGSTK